MIFNQSALRKYVAPEFVFGEGALHLVGQYTNNFGGRKALVVTDSGVRTAGWTGLVEETLRQSGISYVVFDHVTVNPKDHEVMEGADVYLREKCDVIIAVGGGSPIDCAKAIGVVSVNARNILDFEGIDEISIPGPPLICIPTTAGSSADISQFAIITDTNRRAKVAIISKALVPDVALIDPQTTTTMPPDLTAAVGMDALSHAVESYVSNASSYISDLHALEAVRLITGHLPQAIEQPQNVFYRSKVMMGSLLAGLAFSNTSLGLVHSMAHSLGGLFNLAHGECNAILLEQVVAFNFEAAREKYNRIGEAIGCPMMGLSMDAQRDRLQNTLAAFRQSIGIHESLRQLGVTQEDIPRLARAAYHDICLATNPVKPTIQEIERLYERAL